MSDSSDLKILERQASLLQDLLGNLERRREHRRRRGDSSPTSAPVELHPDSAQDPPPAPAPLRLLQKPKGGTPVSGRKPHFREKRRWNLSGAATQQQTAVDEHCEVDAEEAAEEPLPQDRATVEHNTVVRVRGCQVELATACAPGSEVYAFAVLTRNSADGLVRKGFHASADSEREAELACLDAALRYLEGAIPSAPAIREVLRVQGRQVEILCDAGSEGDWRAYPFLHEDGGRYILLRFHIQEALTAPTAVDARQRCIDRLQDYFKG